MQSELIKMLYGNFIESSDPPYKSHLLNDRINTNTKSIKRILNRKNKNKLDLICKDYEEINIMDVENAFADGFSLAVQLLSEAYAHK